MTAPGFVKGYSVPPPSGDKVKPWIDYKAAKKAEERKHDDKVAEAEKQIGIAAGASKDAPLVESAQTVARKLGAYGPVTIDDVIREMERLGWRNIRGTEGGKAKNWKGSVFASSEWACVGSISSRDKTAHGRHVRQWALKSWLKDHPVNGTNSEASAFSLWRLYQEAAHFYPAGTELAFILGRSMLDSSFDTLVAGNNIRYRQDGSAAKLNMDLYGCRVYVVNGIGATVMPVRGLENEIRQIGIEHDIASRED
jgi:hypothetical protein